MAVPQFLTVIEAGRVLRVGRTVAYAETRRFRESDGREGIPCVEVGGQIRVPTAELERLAGRPIDETSLQPRSRRPDPAPSTPPAPRAVGNSSATSSRRLRPAPRSSAPTLPFAG